MGAPRMHTIGPATFSFGGTDMKSYGNIRISVMPNHALLYTGENGTTPDGGRYLGYDVTATIPVTRETWAHLKEMSPHTTLTADTRLVAGKSVAGDFEDYAQWLIIKPVGKYVTNGDDVSHNPWGELFLYAVPIPQAELIYGEEQAVYEVQFRAIDASLSAEESDSWLIRFGPENEVASQNFGFETGDFTNWHDSPSGAPDVTNEIVDTDQHTGTYSYHSKSTEGYLGKYMDDVFDETGAEYVVGCYAKCISVSAESDGIRLLATVTIDGVDTNKSIKLTANSEWTHYDVGISVDSGSLTNSKVSLIGEGEAYWDDAQVVKVS